MLYSSVLCWHICIWQSSWQLTITMLPADGDFANKEQSQRWCLLHGPLGPGTWKNKNINKIAESVWCWLIDFEVGQFTCKSIPTRTVGAPLQLLSMFNLSSPTHTEKVSKTRHGWRIFKREWDGLRHRKNPYLFLWGLIDVEDGLDWIGYISGK